MSKQIYTAKDLAELLEVSESKAYGLIRQMNEELTNNGYITCRGRVPRAYVEQRMFGMKGGTE